MTSRTLRRRLHHGDVDGEKREHLETSAYDSLNEPLLGYDNNNNDNDRKHYNDSLSEERALAEILDDRQIREGLHWKLIFSQLITQCAQWLANVVFRSGTLIGWLFSFAMVRPKPTGRLLPSLLSPLQEARLTHLKQRLAVSFDGSFMEHQEALGQLWRLAYPDRQLPPLKSELWKEMGWQGLDPSTDFRGGGFISLENLIFFAKTYPESFQDLLHKRNGKRSEWEYPFAVAGINVSFMLVQMLDLQSGTPSTLAGIHFLELLTEDEMAFDNLFCVAYQMLDVQWLAKNASYMEFNDVLKSTRTHLERELSHEDISSIKDLPAYNLLKT